MNTTDIVATLFAYFIINALSLIIALQVKKHLGPLFSHYTFVFVSLVALYYLVDVISRSMPLSTDYYFYLWILVILTQALFFVLSIKRRRRDNKS